MRDFTDRDGNAWTATVHEEEGTDYKGRFYLVFRASGGNGGEELPLRDVRWNSERTAQRTLRTMSVVELRRRLRQAVGRSRAPASAHQPTV